MGHHLSQMSGPLVPTSRSLTCHLRSLHPQGLGRGTGAPGGCSPAAFPTSPLELPPQREDPAGRSHQVQGPTDRFHAEVNRVCHDYKVQVDSIAVGTLMHVCHDCLDTDTNYYCMIHHSVCSYSPYRQTAVHICNKLISMKPLGQFILKEPYSVNIIFHIFWKNYPRRTALCCCIVDGGRPRERMGMRPLPACCLPSPPPSPPRLSSARRAAMAATEAPLLGIGLSVDVSNPRK